MSKVTRSPLPKPTPLSKSPLGASGISLPKAKANPSAGGTVPPPTKSLNRAVKPKTGRPASAELVTIIVPDVAGTPMPAVGMSFTQPELVTPPSGDTMAGAVPPSRTSGGVKPSLKLNANCGVGMLRFVTVSVTTLLVTELFGPVATTLYWLPEKAGWTLVIIKPWETAPVIGTLLLNHW